jgi:O-antigen biosynthesis protein
VQKYENFSARRNVKQDPPRATRRILEHVLGGRLASYYRRLRMYSRRWRHSSGIGLPIWNAFAEQSYRIWVREEAVFFQAVREGRQSLLTLSFQPKIAILMAVQAPSSPWLLASISSVCAQWYSQWELWLCVDDAASLAYTLSSPPEQGDERIKLLTTTDTTNIAVQLNEALSQTSCEFIGLLGQDDTLAPHALYEVVKRLQHEVFDYCYSDEDHIDTSGRRSQPFFKPGWSPELALSSLYACRFGVSRREFVRELGGFRPDFVACLDYDLLLRCVARSDRIAHIARVLYHKRAPQAEKITEDRAGAPYASTVVHERAKASLLAVLNRKEAVATVTDGPTPCTFQVRRQIVGEPRVSIIIPTRDRLNLLRPCLESIQQRTTYRNYEILIIDNQSQDPQTLAYLASLPYRVIRNDEPFNFARLNNQAVAEASGAYVLLLNNDIEVISPEWLTAMLEHAQRKEIGAVGAQLLYADKTIQHAGVVLGLLDIAGHAHKYLPSAEAGYFFFSHLLRNYSAVTAACLLTRKALYEEIGGMNERLAVTFNDVDFCLRLQEKGYRIVYTPHAQLYHHESRSRWRQPPPEEEAHYMRERWGSLLISDPYYNPHLTLKREDFSFDLRRARRLLTV